MKKTCLFLLLLTACAHWADYQPQLATQPKNHAKYEVDRKYCLDEAVKRKDKSVAYINSDMLKTPREMADECIAAKGYDVIPQQHCC